MAFTDTTKADILQQNFVSVQPLGSTINSAQDAAQFEGMQADLGKLNVQITLAKANSHHSITKTKTSTLANQIGVFLAYVSTLIGVGKLVLRTFESKWDGAGEDLRSERGLLEFKHRWGGSSFRLIPAEKEFSSVTKAEEAVGSDLHTNSDGGHYQSILPEGNLTKQKCTVNSLPSVAEVSYCQ
jgi:hypothetical protein